MKIICNKIEFAQIVRNCYKADGRCDLCLLSGICGGGDSVVALADVEEEREPPERRMCIKCKWWRADIKGATCGKHTGLAMVTPYTSCSYWEPVEMIKEGDTDE